MYPTALVGMSPLIRWFWCTLIFPKKDLVWGFGKSDSQAYKRAPDLHFFFILGEIFDLVPIQVQWDAPGWPWVPRFPGNSWVMGG